MHNKTQTETRETQSELDRNGLGTIQAQFDDTDLCYLSGSAESLDAEANAVEIAQNHGARLVVDGIVAPGQSTPHLHRKHAMPGVSDQESHSNTPAGRILGGADLSDRIFDSGVASVQTGTPLSSSNNG